MNDSETSNEQVCCDEDIVLGNDGCTVISERSPISPISLSDSPRTVAAKQKKVSLMASLKGVLFEDFRFEDTPEYSSSLKKYLIDGKDVLSYSPEDVDKMSVDYAKALLSRIELRGNMRKKGFRGLQLWKRRFFELLGSTLLYFEVLSDVSFIFPGKQPKDGKEAL